MSKNKLKTQIKTFKSLIKYTFVIMNFRILLLLLFIVFFLASCRKENCFDCIKGVGKHTTEKRELSYFKIITINDPFQVYLIQDSINKIELEGGENLINSVSTEINDNELIINNFNKCNWARSYKNSIITLNIHFKKLDILYINGECDVFSKDTINSDVFRLDFGGIGSLNIKVNSKEFYLWQTGNGDFTISGKANYYLLGSLGSGNVYSNNLKSHFIDITSKSTADCYINTDNILNVTELGYGNIYYSGKPKSINIKTIVGNGKLIEN
ncbi:MAG: hypothetical protein A2046_14400 [Bacteroidetes bacterium GWA2_30_7]|nr:MAG: hypothetical protein A2046_14400 [Bacteroidetes bacterium GWA2_30_7]